MKLFIASVYDQGAESFGRPIFVVARGLAIRSFIDECQREAADNSMFAHPGDFTLYHLGTFDDQTGEFEPVIPPTMLFKGADAKDQK